MLDDLRRTIRQTQHALKALRRTGSIVWRRLREPRTIPMAALKILRAARSGALVQRLLRRGGSEPQDTFYPEWYVSYAALTSEDRHAIRQRISELAPRPRYSVLLHVNEAPEVAFSRAIQSVRAQLYPDWQLCVADSSRASHVRVVLEELARQDERIHVVPVEPDRHPLNDLLALATGDFVVQLEPESELAEHAMFVLASEAAGEDLVYSDEDEVDASGRPSSSFFKPDWNPDLLWSQDYIGDFCAIRRSLLTSVGGFREGFEGSELYDAILRASTRTDRIRHVPFVLVHRRPTSSHSSGNLSSRRAVQEQIGVSSRVEPGPLPATRRLHWPVPQPGPLVSLIVPTRDARHLLQTCIESLITVTSYRHFEVIVVDNQSREQGTLDYLAELERRGAARVVRFDARFNFSAINNLAVREHARGELVGLLNNDLEVIEAGWLEEMVSQAIRPEIGAVGARLLYPDRTLQHGGIMLGIGGSAGHAHRFLPANAPGYRGRAQLVQDVSAVTAACLVIRRDTWARAGGMDEGFPVALNDVDFCLRVRALGLRNLWTPFATLVHHESATRGYEDTQEKKARFAADKRLLEDRWGKVLRNDPAYNPNLSLESEDFSLAWPPRVRKPWE